MQTTTFPTHTAEVDTVTPPPDSDGRGALQLACNWGLPQGDNILVLQRYVTQFDPETALAIGTAMADEARALIEKYPPKPKSDLIPATPAQAAQAAQAHAALDGVRA